MVVDEKITNAEYFLNKIKNATNREDFLPNLSAFLSETRSIADYLLEDYNVKFGLGINANLNTNNFIKTAIRQKNQSAIDFIIAYMTKFNELKQDPIGNFLIVKRNTQVHITQDPLHANFSANLPETENISDSVAVEVRDKYGNLKTYSGGLINKFKSGLKKIKSNNELIKQSSTNSVTVKWFFTDYRNTDVVDACETFLKLMKNFVNDLKNEFL
jgi:hypothetical protein